MNLWSRFSSIKYYSATKIYRTNQGGALSHNKILLEGACTIRGDVLIEESALTEVVFFETLSRRVNCMLYNVHQPYKIRRWLLSTDD